MNRSNNEAVNRQHNTPYMLEPKTDISFLPPSNLTEAPRASRPTPMTYGQLLEHGKRYLSEQGISRQQVNNLLSALRRWIDAQGFSLSRVVAEEFDLEFDLHFARYCDALEDLAPRTQGDRQEQILRWKRIVAALRTRDTLPDSFHEALAHSIELSPLPRRQIALDAGMGTNTLYLWSTGGTKPSPALFPIVARLEEVLELPQGTLQSRLPLLRRARYARDQGKKPNETSFTKTRRAQKASGAEFRLKATARLNGQWHDLLTLKTDPMRDHARARNTWRLKPVHKVSQRITEAMLFDGQVCVTAGMQWGFWASYLGWLHLPQGENLPLEMCDTLGWLADPDRVIKRAKWMMRHSGGKFHNGVSVFLQLVASYLRSDTGYVWLTPALRETVPDVALLEPESGSESANDGERWRRHCELAREKVIAFQKRALDTMGIRQSRDTTERPAVVLHDEFPLKKLVEFMGALERSAPPPAHKRDYVAWIRDVTLLRMIVSNPHRPTRLERLSTTMSLQKFGRLPARTSTLLQTALADRPREQWSQPRWLRATNLP